MDDTTKAKLSSLELELRELGVRSLSTSTTPGVVDKQRLAAGLIAILEAFLSVRKAPQIHQLTAPCDYLEVQAQDLEMPEN